MLCDLTTFIEQQRANEVILAGDFNQDVFSDPIKIFLIQNKMFNIHETTNNISRHDIDSTYKYGSKMIDIIATTTELIEYVDGCKMNEFTEILITDYRDFIVDFNLEDYFKVN